MSAAGLRLALRLLFVAWYCGPSPAAAAQTVYFAHDDARYLYGHQREGGAALVPDPPSVEIALPLVVFLHGTNPSGALHLWMGGGGRDLRPLVRGLMRQQAVRPLVFAAPSQTKQAALARTAWQGFDLQHFVDDLVSATSNLVQIDRTQVMLVGHSAAGCNPQGGLVGEPWSDPRDTLRALVSIDPCLNKQLGRALARRPASVPLWLSWQSAIWKRSPKQFTAGLTEHRPEGRVDRLLELPTDGPNPHEAIVPVALERALREAFPGPPPEEDEAPSAVKISSAP